MTIETDSLYSSLGEAERYAKELEWKIIVAGQGLRCTIEDIEKGLGLKETSERLKYLKDLLKPGAA